MTEPLLPPASLQALRAGQQPPPAPGADSRRLARLQARGQAAYQYVAEAAARICHTPMAAITLLDGDEVWFLATVGMPPLERLPLAQSFCPHVLACSPEPLLVPDAQADQRFAQLPQVVQAPEMRLYAGAPITSAQGVLLGVLSVGDTAPRELSPVPLRTLSLLARQAAMLLQAQIEALSETEAEG